MNDVVFLDTETTGLDPDRHEIWELGYIIDGNETRVLLYPDMSKADPFALNIGRFYERCANWTNGTGFHESAYSARQFVSAVRGRHLVGAVPSFDDAFLKRWVAKHQLPVTWHYHLIDVEALAVGYLAARGNIVELPWNSENLSWEVGISPDLFDRHTALGDARWAKAIYHQVMTTETL